MGQPIIPRLMSLFDGLDRAYGRYIEPQGEDDQGRKKKGRGITLQKPLTSLQWEEHLSGAHRLGIIPIRDDNQAQFGAIDVDDYSLSIESFSARTKGSPLLVTRSKSGGAHAWLFLSEPAPASGVRSCLQSWAMYLGYPQAEIFPKQDTLASRDDVGNWIHVPYFDSARTMCYGLLDGRPLKLEDWISLAEKGRISPEDLKTSGPPENDFLPGAPPCLQAFARNGVPEGERNRVLFALGVYAKKIVESDPGRGLELGTLVDEMNTRILVPPLGRTEVNDTLKSLGRRQYFYPCTKPPLTSVCNKQMCRQAEFGIGGSPHDPGITIDSITKIDSDPPLYFVQVNGKRITVPDAATLINQRLFQQLIFQALDILPSTIPKLKWEETLNQLMIDCDHIEAPSDAGIRGVFLYHLNQFCTTRAQAKDMDEILQGKPFRDDNNYIWFRSSDLLNYLERQRFREYRPHQIWGRLREELKAQHRFVNLRGRGINLWGVSMEPEEIPVEELEPFKVHRINKPDTFEEDDSWQYEQ